MPQRKAKVLAFSSVRDATARTSQISGHSLREGTCTMSAMRPAPMMPTRTFSPAIASAPFREPNSDIINRQDAKNAKTRIGHWGNERNPRRQHEHAFTLSSGEIGSHILGGPGAQRSAWVIVIILGSRR